MEAYIFFKQLCLDLGFAPDKIAPFLVLLLVLIFLFNKRFKSIEITIKKIKEAIIEMQTIFRNKDCDIVYSLIEGKGSPLRPSQYGATLIKESGFEKILDENKEFLSRELKKLLPSDYSDYDVQEKARQVLLDLKDNPMMRPVKDYVFEEALSIETILRTGGLWLRDDFLGNPRKTIE